MAFSLYEINSQIEQVWGTAVDPDTGEIINEDALQELEQLGMQREEKLENLALFYKNLSAEAEALKAEKMRLAARQAAAEKKAEGIKKYIAASMDSAGGEKIKTSKVAIGWRKSESVQVEENAFLPDEYLTFKAPEPNKTAIKKALKAGEKIDGASLVTANNIQIK
jgi:hypothetical protein